MHLSRKRAFDLPGRVFVVAVATLTIAAHASNALAASIDVTVGEPTTVAKMTGVPANVPHDYVVTPNGYFHPSCVQSVASDETVHGDGSIVGRDGMTRRVPNCGYPHFTADGAQLAADSAPMPSARTSNPPDIEGWIVYASYTVSEANAATWLVSNMSVPSAPSVPAGQVVYFFPGLEDAANVQTILQPVLGWNAFNDGGWTVASWNCCMSGHTWHSAPVHVATGDTLYGAISSSNCTGHLCTDWAVLTRDLDSGNDTTLNTSGYGQSFSWIFGAVLEAYGITQCGHLPQSGTEEFSQIFVRTIGRPLTSTMQLPTWQSTVIPNSPDCGYAATPHPVANSPQITLSY